MTAIALKKRIHQVVDTIDDTNLLKAVYTILQKSSKEDECELTEIQLKELNKRIDNHQKGKTKNIPWRESIQSIRKQLKK